MKALSSWPNRLKNGQVLLLENLRFHAGEEANDPTFASQLARLGQSFSLRTPSAPLHRKHASTYGVPSVMPVKGMGFLIEKELKFLDPPFAQSRGARFTQS